MGLTKDQWPAPGPGARRPLCHRQGLPGCPAALCRSPPSPPQHETGVGRRTVGSADLAGEDGWGGSRQPASLSVACTASASGNPLAPSCRTAIIPVINFSADAQQHFACCKGHAYAVPTGTRHLGKPFWSSNSDQQGSTLAAHFNIRLRIICKQTRSCSWAIADTEPVAARRLIAVALHVPGDHLCCYLIPLPPRPTLHPCFGVTLPRWCWRRGRRSIALRRHGRPELQHAPVYRRRVRAAGQPRAPLACARGAAAAAPPAVQLERRPLPPGLSLGPGQVCAVDPVRPGVAKLCRAEDKRSPT